MDSENTTLIDNIFLADFKLYQSEKRSFTYIHSELMTQKKLEDIAPKIAFMARIYKDYPFYFMVEADLYEEHGQQLSDLVLSYTEDIQKFLEDVTLRKGFSRIEQVNKLQLSTMNFADQVVGYYIKAQFKTNDIVFDFSVFIPRKTLNHFTALILKKNIAKIDDINLLTEFLQNMRTEFYKKNISFPLDVVEFLNAISDQNLQKIIALLLSNNSITYDMLCAVTSRMEDGFNRVINNLSKNQKADFLKAREKQTETDYRWVQIVLYQIGLNLDKLLKEKKLESVHIDRIKRILLDIFYQELDLFFFTQPFYQWLENTNDDKILQELLSQSNDIALAKSFISFNEDNMNLIKKNSSKRKYQYLLEDINYQKRKCSNKDEIAAQYEVLQTLMDLNFKKLPVNEKNLEIWIHRFTKMADFNFAVNVVGPVEFSLALVPLPVRLKRMIIKNLKPPVKYFFYYFLANKIKLNFPYGDVRIKEAANEVIRVFYQLEQEGKIELKSFAQVEEELNSVN